MTVDEAQGKQAQRPNSPEPEELESNWVVSAQILPQGDTGLRWVQLSFGYDLAEDDDPF